MKKLFWLLPLLTAVSLAGTINQTVNFARSDLSFRDLNGYKVVNLNGALATSEIGRPLLPAVNLNVLIPATAEIRQVEVVSSDQEALDGVYQVYPCQPPRPMIANLPEPDFVPPDPSVYESDAAFPGKLVEYVPSGSECGYRIAGVLVYPLQYLPRSGRLALYTQLKLKITYDEGVHPAKVIAPSQAELFGPRVASLVVNAEAVKSFAPASRARDGEVDYCVITPASLAQAWTPLLDLRRCQGMNAIVMPVETIYARYPGTDQPEKIRNFIIDYWQTKGLKWVVLGGDQELVPTRYAYLNYSPYNVPADVYYADLDWSWDSNHNGEYGEMTGDTLDLLGDVFVGRVPCDDAQHVANFINKDTIYELHPDTGYIRKILLPWEDLWANIGHYGFLVNNVIKGIMPPGWQSDVEQALNTVIQDSLNAGYHFMHFAGHGSSAQFGYSFYSSNVPNLNNVASHKLTIINSMACDCGEFDDAECLAESLVNYQYGGAVAAMLNARFGWGAPPNLGPSEHLSVEFYRQWALHSELGVAAGIARDWFRNVAMSQLTYRWSVYDLTTFGDPAMPMWTQAPQTMAVDAPDSVPGAPQTLRVLVRQGSTPVPGATASLLSHNRVVATGRTNSQGWVELPVAPNSGDTLQLWASARDHLPLNRSIRVLANRAEPCLVLQSVTIDDHNNGHLDVGETSDVCVALRNSGTASVGMLDGVLNTTSPFVTLIDAGSSYGTIAPGDTARGDAYRVAVTPNCPNGARAEFVVFTSSGESALSYHPFFELVLGRPPLHGAYWATHDTGDFILSVTGLGSIGSTGWRAEGIGFIWPKDYAWSATQLMLGSLVLGTDTGYVCDRFYHPDFPANDTDFVMVDSVRPVIPPERADEEYVASFSDAGHRRHKGLLVTQKSMVLARPGMNDFAILEYTINNAGANAVDSLAAGVFADFKVSGWNVNDSLDQAGADTSMRTAWCTDNNSAWLGVRVLGPTGLLGASAIDAYRYVQAPGMMSDVAKDSFLWGKKKVMSGTNVQNWAAMVSTGPLSIPPGHSQTVAFALIGAPSLVALRTEGDSAQAWYEQHTGIAAPAASPPAVGQVRFLVSPSVFGQSLTIEYAVPASRRLRVEAFDAAGRLLESVFDRDVMGPGRLTWRPKGSQCGVFFLKVNGEMAKVVKLAGKS